MKDNEHFNIPVPKNIDTLIENGVMKAVREKRRRKVKNFTSVFSTIFAVLFVVGLVNPVFASKVSLLKSAFAMIESKTFFPGNYSKYATSIGKSVTYKGISVTLSEILCDGESLYATYIVKNTQPFKDILPDQVLNQEDPPKTTQLMIAEEYNKVSFSSKELQITGAAGLDGYFVDDKTFVGMRKYDIAALTNNVPSEFTFETKFTQIDNSASQTKNPDLVDGIWKLKVPVKTDKSITRTIKPLNTNQNGYSISSIIITPFETKVETTNPKEDSNLDYFCKIYDENGTEVDKGTEYMAGTNRLHTFKALSKDCKKIRIELYRYIYPVNSTVEAVKEVISDNVIQLK